MTAREEIKDLPSEAAHATVRHMRAEALFDLCELLESYAITSREAVRRGDDLETGTGLWRARLTLIDALTTFRELAPAAAATIFDGKTEAGAESKPRGRAPDAR
jgi:hypothetical protein